jgi:hypothetical protein
MWLQDILSIFKYGGYGNKNVPANYWSKSLKMRALPVCLMDKGFCETPISQE